MSSGRLKASTNRVRTSVALQQTSIWTSAIGVEKHENTNSVIEATLNAPGLQGGARARRAAAAAQAAEAYGGGAANDYKGLMELARKQGAVTGAARGACKRCGQLGHLTKQCRNQFSRFFDGGPDGEKAAAAAAAAGLPTAAISMAPLAEGNAAEDDDDSLNDLLSSSSSDSDSSSSSSDSEAERRRRKERKRKRKHQKEKERKRKKEKEHKKRSSSKLDKKRSSSSSKHKRRRQSPSPSDS